MAISTKRTPRWVNSSIPEPTHAGLHLIGDFWGCKLIDSKKEIEEILLLAAKAANSTPLKTSVHKFEPQGVTGIILLAESHISIHTWPEIGFVAVDIFTCGADARPGKAMEVLQDAFTPREVDIHRITRGEELWKNARNV